MTKYYTIASTTLIFILLASCSEKKESFVSAQQAAEKYYNCLASGQYDDFANGIYAPDSLPADYRAQLIDAAAQFAVKDTKKNGGLQSAHAISQTLNADSTGYATLELTFGNGSKEETIVPLIKTESGWKMR